jgi:hypothetical protein
LQELYTRNYQTFGTLMNLAIAMEGLQHDTQVEWKHKRGIFGSSSYRRLKRCRLSRGCPTTP